MRAVAANTLEPGIFLTAADWCVRIWDEQLPSAPLFQSRCVHAPSASPCPPTLADQSLSSTAPPPMLVGRRPQRAAVSCATWSSRRAGQLLAGLADGTLQLWDVATQQNRPMMEVNVRARRTQSRS